jgi:hypothetical protein
MSVSRTILAAALFTFATFTTSSAQIRDRPSFQPTQPLPQSREEPQRAAPPLFQAPELVSGIVSGPLALLWGEDRQAAKLRLFYVVGFSMAADKACDFLTAGTVRELLRMVSPAVELANEGASDRGNGALLAHMAAGIKDGTAFTARNTCASSGGKQIARSLVALWESV